MIKKISLICLLGFVFLFNTHTAQAGSGDKIAHAGVSFIISTAAYNFYIQKTNMSENQAKLAAFFTALSVGLIKETVDSDFDGDDLAMDALGAGAGAAIGFKF